MILRARTYARITLLMNNALHTFEILLGKDKTTIRATLADARAYVCNGHDGRNMVKRGFTTYRIYDGKKEVGSMQALS
jgi:hypothetical protein